ncbi:hypothetical protein E7V67_001910 [[Empedobacter] haloabium]|uniref:Uncharacterized protein n=1 Tax=[Empedobacter] haloabium TaxID=592317 RepID=A0ABZ1UMI1_9BURK
MTPQQAAQLLEQLALGIDPRTGVSLAEHDACTTPDVIRALFIARNALQGKLEPARKAPVVRNGVTLANVGKKWSGEEVDTLLQEFQAGALPDRESGYTLLKAQRPDTTMVPSGQ